MSHAPRTCRSAGAILAGGQAKRLGGIAKGAIDADGVSVVERLIGELRLTGVADILIVANDPSPYRNCGVEIVPDRRRGHGPVGGIETALLEFSGRADATVLAPCDAPRLSAQEFRRLVDAFESSDSSGVFAQTGEFFCHPLCAVVHNAILPHISAAIDAGNRSVQELWRELGLESVDFDDDAPFTNINTPEDLADYQGSRR